MLTRSNIPDDRDFFICKPAKRMTFKQTILIALTAVIALLLGIALFSSLNQPQIQSRLELYQTNLVLRASNWQPPTDDPQLQELRDLWLGEEIFQSSLEQYQESRQSTVSQIEELRSQQAANLLAEESELAQSQQLDESIAQLQELKNRLDLRIGLLQVQQGKTEEAIAAWTDLSDRDNISPSLAQTAWTLEQLWSQPPQVESNAEATLQQNLDGWFQTFALERLYRVQNRDRDLAQLQAQTQAAAQTTLIMLAIVNGFSLIAIVLGLGFLAFLGWQRVVKGKDSVLAAIEGTTWQVPWNWETIVQGVIVGFFVVFFFGQVIVSTLIVPLAVRVANIDLAAAGIRGQAASILVSYLLAGAASLGVVYLSVKPFLPLPKDWFRFNLKGLWAGLAGYFIAVPLVVFVSLLNESIWQGRGGSNPILPIALEGRDTVAIVIFFITASILAPVFEELMFRGFLLPSLTRYLPAWGAIAASSAIFAFAHLSLSEVLPLATLGMVLGAVYLRSKSIVAPIFLHCLWNSATLASVFVLGGGVS